MSFIEDNDLHAQYAIDCAEREKIADTYTPLELANMFAKQPDDIEERYRDMVLNISNLVIKGNWISAKQYQVLKNAYINNWEIDRDYH